MHQKRQLGRFNTGSEAAQVFSLKSLVRLGVPLAAAAACFFGIINSARADAGSCLRFNGTNGYAAVAHDGALNAFPLTITAWIRTSRTALLYDGIVNKYFPGAANGYSLHLYNGRVRAWYFRNSSNYVYPADPGFDGGFVADGQWHYVALVVGPTGGTIYVDGVSRGSPQGWTGTAGATTSTTPITIGRYATSPSYTNTFAGDIDEVGIWNRALTLNEINYLKHRRLNGNEDGLLSLWHLDEGVGPTSADAAPTARLVTLNGNVAWTPSAAPIALSMIATNCLRFDGATGYVQVPHNTNLNAYPLTAMGWFCTTNTTSFVQGIVSKYADASGNGWSLFVQNGKLRGFYYRPGFISAIDATSAAIVADGGWHHAALTVDAAGGKLCLDGNVVGTGSWVSPGLTTNSEPLLIGCYYPVLYTQRFQGTLDEISVWNRALATNEISAIKNRPLAGNEANLVAYWRLDEGTGTSVADATGHGYNGAFVSTPAWTGSTAYLGDGSVHLLAATDIPLNQRLSAIDGAYQANSFTEKANASLWRFYDFGSAPPNSTVTIHLDAGLLVAGSGTPVTVKPNTYVFTFGYAAYNAFAPAQIATFNQVINLEPQTGVQLDSVNNLHQMTASLSHNENGGVFNNDGTESADVVRLLHFNGKVYFGPLAAVITNVVNNPAPGAIFVPNYLQSQLQFAAGSAYLAAAPSFKFGGGAAFTVNLGVDGTATNVNGSFSLANATQFFETNGIRYRIPGAALNAAGLTATSLEAWFPAGFGMAVSTNVRAMTPFAMKTNIVLGPDLLPTTSTVTFTAADYHTNRLYFAEETKPFFIGASQIEWHIPQGEFYLAQADSLKFVRQEEDDDLAAQKPNLVEPLAAERISNDGYYHNATMAAGVPIYIRPDANEAALLTMQATLQETEFRPHFPYLSTSVGGHVPVVGGALSISNDLIDPAASYLLLAGPVPVPYARDCPPEGGCSSSPTIGPQVLSFTAPAGHLGLGELGFTPDGGLLANGTIPPANLTWGFAGGTNYAQRTSDVSAGSYHVPGTFLRGDQTQMPDSQRPAVLLFTGWGQPTNTAYVERPYSSAYDDGFANYAGLNFRAPAMGRSFIAGMNAGPYPLTTRSKYYVRYGGVSGIHEAASFPANLTLYGYAFTFQSYRLSYLDSANWESRTDGQVALPYPSAFNVEFQRMKFLCRGNLDSPQLPANIGMKHLAYWNTDLRPLALQFKPMTGDPCSLTKRYLVLGVETKLPFIPQAFQTALAIKNNGNLANDLTAVEGVDSRFPVPANLSLQGPGGSSYPFNTAAKAYFNNWETTGRPDAGFYNLVGRVRVPFFRDVKVQLHITPTTATTAQLALMGGWPAEDGSGLNRGWNTGTQNYFNNTGFDPSHDGWPTSVKISDYRNFGDETYHPRAQQNWIDVAFFDYPLAWNSVLREFAGYAPAPVVLPVIDVDSRLKELSPGKVDLDFAQDLNVNLPRVKVLDFANDALNELNAPLNSVSSAIQSQLGAAFNTVGLTSGFRSLQNVLRENPEGFFRPLLEPALDPVVDKIYTNLAAQMASSGKAVLLANAPGIVMAGSSGLQSTIMNLNGSVGQANTVLKQLDGSFGDVDDTLGLFLRVLEKDSGGNRHVVRAIVQKLTQDQGPVLGFVGSLADSFVNDLLHDLEPTLANIEGQLNQLRTQFGQLRGQITGASGDFASALNAANHSSATLTPFMQQAGNGVATMLNSSVGPAGDYFTADPARAKREIRERLVVAFLGSSLAGAYQTAFRQFLSDPNAQLTQLTDVLFDQVNNAIRDGLSSQIAGAQDSKFQSFKGGGLLTGSLLSAKIRGAPTFEGDSLRRIHLDAAIQMNLPDEMNFTAYLDIKELNSATTPISCIPPGAPAAEVIIGARDVSLDWLGVTPGSPLKLSVEARWTLQSGTVLGVGGSFDVNGKIGFKGCSINDFGASLAFGQTENYFAAKAGATVLVLGIPVDFTAGIFAGKACSLDPLKFVDPEVEDVLIVNATEFTGVYLQFGGGLSLSDILFGTSSCVLDVAAHVNGALYYQGGPRFGSIGGRQKVGVDVDLICIISASADWATAMRLDSVGKLTIQGQARLCGKIGACPFCLKACKSLKVTGIVTDGGIDYDIDF
jgi:hypothetical protein